MAELSAAEAQNEAFLTKLTFLAVLVAVVVTAALIWTMGLHGLILMGLFGTVAVLVTIIAYAAGF